MFHEAVIALYKKPVMRYHRTSRTIVRFKLSPDTELFLYIPTRSTASLPPPRNVRRCKSFPILRLKTRTPICIATWTLTHSETTQTCRQPWIRTNLSRSTRKITKLFLYWCITATTFLVASTASSFNRATLTGCAFEFAFSCLFLPLTPTLLLRRTLSNSKKRGTISLNLLLPTEGPPARRFIQISNVRKKCVFRSNTYAEHSPMVSRSTGNKHTLPNSDSDVVVLPDVLEFDDMKPKIKSHRDVLVYPDDDELVNNNSNVKANASSKTVRKTWTWLMYIDDVVRTAPTTEIHLLAFIVVPCLRMTLITLPRLKVNLLPQNASTLQNTTVFCYFCLPIQ